MPRKKKTETAEPGFEELMTGLEKIAGELESGELGLEGAIARYEAGVKMYRQCHRILVDAEKKVEILTRDRNGELRSAPFDDSDGNVSTGKTNEDNSSSGSEGDPGSSLF